MTIDDTEVEPTKNYTFEKPGEHKVNFLLDSSNYIELNKMFYGIKKLTSISFTSRFNSKRVVNMNQMFYGCNSLTSIDISNLNTSSAFKSVLSSHSNPIVKAA